MCGLLGLVKGGLGNMQIDIVTTDNGKPIATYLTGQGRTLSRNLSPVYGTKLFIFKKN